jgi:hypothetical protein
MDQGPTTFGGERVTVVGKKGKSTASLGAPNAGGQNADKSIGSSPKVTSTSADTQTTVQTYGGK